MRKLTLSIFALFFFTGLMCQENSWFGKGSIDASFNSFNNDFNNSEYPLFYSNIYLKQNINLANIPVSINGFYSDLNKNNTYGFLPNYFNFSFDQNGFRKQIIEKVNSENERIYLAECSKKRKQIALHIQSQQIDSFLTAYDETAINKTIEDYGILKANQTEQDSIEYYDFLINELNEYKLSWKNLKSTREKYDSLYNDSKANDSIINNYTPISFSNFNRNKKGIRTKYQLAGVEKIAMSVERLNAGRFAFTAHPFISQSSFVDGMDLKISPSQFSISALFGRLNTVYLPYSNIDNSYSSVISGGSFGFDIAGSGTEIFTYFINRNNSITNNIIGISNISSITKKINLTFVLSGSQYVTGNEDSTNQYNYESLPVEYSYNNRNYIYNILFQKKSMNFITGYAFDSKLNFTEIFRGNRLFTGYEYISPTYFSLASPFLIKDISAICIGTEQSFMERKLKITVSHRIRDKKTTELYSYSAGWQSTGIKAIYRPGANISLFSQYQINKRSSENSNSNYQIINASCSYTENKLVNSSHVIQAYYVEHPGNSNFLNLNYIVTIPVVSSLDISIGYGTHFQNENIFRSLRTDLALHPGKKASHNFTLALSSDNVCREYYGGYSLRIELFRNCIAEIISGYGSFIFSDPVLLQNGQKNSLTGNIRLMYLW